MNPTATSMPASRAGAAPDRVDAGKGRIRIGLVVPSLQDNGGVQTIVEALVRRIEASPSHDYILVSLATSSSDECSTKARNPSTWLKGASARELSWRGRKVMHVGCSMAELEFMHYSPRDLLREVLAPCDVIQVVSGFPAWGAAVLDLGRPVCVWAATRVQWERRRLLEAGRGPKALWRRVMTSLTNRLDARVIKRAEMFLVMNPLMREYVAGVRPDGAQTMDDAPPGVDVDWFRPDPGRMPAAGQGIVPYILSVGRFADPRKNPELLLEAFSLLSGNAPGAKSLTRLVLAGATPPPDAFWRKAAELKLAGRVEFKPNPESAQLRALYQGASCLALSSDEEGFGMAIVEAMACGVPVVATRCGGPEGIITDGLDGFLVRTGDAAALAARLSRLCGDPELNRALGDCARRTVEKRFSEGSLGSKFFRTWDAMLAGRHAGRG